MWRWKVIKMMELTRTKREELNNHCFNKFRMNKVRQKEERRGLDGRIVTQTKNFLRNLEVNSKYFIRNKIMLYRLSRLDVFKKALIADYYWSPSMELRAH
jgi:hypothetical protein